ncbi:fibrous sheath-interacting protein 1-like isoform X1 [Biomphalaria glabrata]|uniref:Fibrous sheath-interacting protein 1 n=1 Tax=Biomphalaria glabrata TaxID=6526 RepID=A0A9W2ZYW0_BIOGL|nr:fibrous sheath-interacting protein 1-like isoform X1 [Biomphalaria glabrata]XP_055880150.1 fibrous sheath-interacting protein 1-like isoform X1 [Biomphalaria glabrata]XP_055880151.1 fibrous sheath-interacting protein 1-like isoform X1 [Biomphalaria glabrata]XP_055880152.1 fibrous sheath-interacting protein 1-like isoform X1 [Biomphalaria glabrata]XP_055880153.1 fibrous sheath-interacting protein 1-like isoform X1 [Biomphalaria glabrata]XP_055880154.1 fibrous sheath-interacting protein 1-lik
MELQQSSQENLAMSESESSEEYDDLEEVNYEELDDDLFPDMLGDLEIKDLDEETRNFISSIFFKDDSDNNDSTDSKKQGTEDSLIQAPVIFNGEKQNVEEDDEVEQDDDDDDDIDSEEEKNILQGIKEEIETKVREEMKEELNGFQARIQALECEIKSDINIDTDDEMDPKLREAIIKMNKLDKILKKKVKQEKEVKKERLLLERRIRKEIGELEQGGSHVREIKLNTEKFLSLELPPSHNEGIKLDDEVKVFPPVFQTQIDEDLLKQSKSGNNKTSDSNHLDKSTTESRISTSRQSDRSGTSMSKVGSKSNKSKNFIKRNKKLASQADEPIAMTDDEKRRLKELLDGIDDLPDVENIDESQETRLQISLQPGEGFCPDSMDKKNLVDIDERLKSIMPEEEFNFLMSTNDKMSSHLIPQTPIFTKVGVKSFLKVDPGEQALFETKEERELNARLLTIEKDLEKFKVTQEMEEDMEKHLTDEQLDRLLDECVRNLSRSSYLESPDVSARSQQSSRQHFFENPPKLTEEQLQQLLSEAHFPMSSKLLAIKEQDDDSQDEDNYFDTISADTWKAIKDAQPLMPEDGNDKQSNSNTSKKAHAVVNIKDQTLCSLNKNMSANNDNDLRRSFSSESYKYNSWSGPWDHIPGSLGAYSVNDTDNNVLQSISDSACGKSSEDFKRFPKISRSCIDFTADVSRGSTSVSSLSQDSSDNEAHSVRLPLLSSSSFLIHAQQGLNTEEMKYKSSVKRPVLTVKNDLTDTPADYSDNKKRAFENQT